MAWKKDLAKLKQELKSEEPQAKAAPPPKVRAPHPVSSSIEEEDAIFLSAMGLRPQPTAREAAPAPQAPPPPLIRAEGPAPEVTREEFSDAMGGLKGMKPIRRQPVAEKPAAAAKPPGILPAVQPSATPKAPSPSVAPTAAPCNSETPATSPASSTAVPSLSPSAAGSTSAPGSASGSAADGTGRETAGAVAPEPPPAAPKAEPAGPVQINLAAGMAIDVDGGLDLRGHERFDAEERLKERILDGYALGWRTLHVHLGASGDLRAMILELLFSPQGSCIARYAQAPIPMGGAHAWILYFRISGSAAASSGENTLFNT